MEQRKNTPTSEPRDSYSTGTTRPPKQYRGIIAVLLALVIFLGGISSILSIMNIRLFEQLFSDGVAVSFSPPENALQNSTLPNIDALGIHGEHIPESYRRYYRLPAGVFITAISEDSPCKRAGLQENDIIISINDQRVTDPEDLIAILRHYPAGTEVTVIYCRDRSQQTAAVTLMAE